MVAATLFLAIFLFLLALGIDNKTDPPEPVRFSRHSTPEQCNEWMESRLQAFYAEPGIERADHLRWDAVFKANVSNCPAAIPNAEYAILVSTALAPSFTSSRSFDYHLLLEVAQEEERPCLLFKAFCDFARHFKREGSWIADMRVIEFCRDLTENGLEEFKELFVRQLCQLLTMVEENPSDEADNQLWQSALACCEARGGMETLKAAMSEMQLAGLQLVVDAADLLRIGLWFLDRNHDPYLQIECARLKAELVDFPLAFDANGKESRLESFLTDFEEAGRQLEHGAEPLDLLCAWTLSEVLIASGQGGTPQLMRYRHMAVGWRDKCGRFAPYHMWQQILTDIALFADLPLDQRLQTLDALEKWSEECQGKTTEWTAWQLQALAHVKGLRALSGTEAGDRQQTLLRQAVGLCLLAEEKLEAESRGVKMYLMHLAYSMGKEPDSNDLDLLLQECRKQEGIPLPEDIKFTYQLSSSLDRDWFYRRDVLEQALETVAAKVPGQERQMVQSVLLALRRQCRGWHRRMDSGDRERDNPIDRLGELPDEQVVASIWTLLSEYGGELAALPDKERCKDIALLVRQGSETLSRQESSDEPPQPDAALYRPFGATQQTVPSSNGTGLAVSDAQPEPIPVVGPDTCPNSPEPQTAVAVSDEPDKPCARQPGLTEILSLRQPDPVYRDIADLLGRVIDQTYGVRKEGYLHWQWICRILDQRPETLAKTSGLRAVMSNMRVAAGREPDLARSWAEVAEGLDDLTDRMRAAHDREARIEALAGFFQDGDIRRILK